MWILLCSGVEIARAVTMSISWLRLFFCFVPGRKCMYFCANFTELGLKGGLLFTKTKHNKCFSNIWASQSKKMRSVPEQIIYIIIK